MVTIEIDGQKLEAESGAMLIEVADKAGIYIPRFCYHDKLSIAANCRMCLVEVEKAPKPLPACATPVMEGMTIHTKSLIAVAAQRGTMEFLLINHPWIALFVTRVVSVSYKTPQWVTVLVLLITPTASVW